MRDDKTQQLGRRETVKQEHILNAASSTPLGQAISEGLVTFQKKEATRLSLGGRRTSSENGLLK